MVVVRHRHEPPVLAFFQRHLGGNGHADLSRLRASYPDVTVEVHEAPL
ncbi:hypothetical protein GA0111570_11629 [Raineyella antarctica]|uniref:Uncharacterized protein n=1 Tax=Raineyella antarctica TaxID=1577474 RepID=A0A1G6II99_9ACTN|nr:hypothetical protein [Raineyella antarctica]SDC05456.1 hypothetical protein GA0111570_11629 [Raineyella antarctica]